MKNILLITNIYPNNDPKYKGTPVCHFYTKEWKDMGYNVKVIHFNSLFPRLFYKIGGLFQGYIRSKTSNLVYTDTSRKPLQYEVDGIPVYYVPIKKLVPHKAPSEKRILKAFSYICDIFEKEGFTPDYITAHFIQPQLQFLHLFKGRYPNAITCMVNHAEGSEYQSYYPKTYKTLMQSVDIFGFRSVAFKEDFEKRFGTAMPRFLCYSGIPDKYLVDNAKEFNNGVKRFVYVGSLYEFKNVHITIKALNNVFKGKDFVFDIVGDGAASDSLHSLVEELGLNDKVKFHGRLKRDDAQKIVDNADCFIMVSTHEAFGLVYVESMAKGCIVVGTKGQGIDGVIKNGENGFLCKACDVDELTEVIRTIISLPSEQQKNISSNAINTARELTNRKVAEFYINSISSVKCK